MYMLDATCFLGIALTICGLMEPVGVYVPWVISWVDKMFLNTLVLISGLKHYLGNAPTELSRRCFGPDRIRDDRLPCSGLRASGAQFPSFLRWNQGCCRGLEDQQSDILLCLLSPDTNCDFDCA